jgi:4-amino-4-deoxy-L-arabinose transferase-like glycosyltransferase
MNRAIPRLTAALSLIWLFTGLIGHQPWKPDEAYSMGLAYSVAQGGSWVVPTLAGEPFMEKPPAFYLVAASTGIALSKWLPFHEGARLACGLFMALTLLCIAWAARVSTGNGSSAVLALISCVGLLVHGHVVLTDVGLLTGFALAYLGFALYETRPRLGAFALGTGVGLGFMTKGLLEPGTMTIVALALPLLFRSWRTAKYGEFLLRAALWSIPWLMVWPLLLWRASPNLFMEWFWVNNFGRFLGFAGLGPKAPSWAYARILPWFALPALPFAAWVCWKARRMIPANPSLQVPVLGFFATLGVLAMAHDARALYALPLLIPLALLAARLDDALPAHIARWITAAGATTYAAVAGLIWVAWFALRSGWPQPLAQWMKMQQPSFVQNNDWANALLAAIFTASWIVLIVRTRARPHASLFAWAGGITLAWALCATLLLAWVDAGKSYRAMMDEISRNLPTPLSCLATRSLGEPQRALVHYYLGVLPRREESGPTTACNAMLVQIRLVDKQEIPPLPAGWTKRWEGVRAGDEKEWFLLYQRE